MGKKRTATVEGQTEKKAKKEMFRWEEAYNDLPIHIATSLREARVKPDQLRTMADGEVLAIEGIHNNDINEIRSKYATDLVAIQETKAEATPEAKPIPTSSRDKHPRRVSGRSSQYKGKITKVEKKQYSLQTAIPLLRQISYSKHKTIELHINTKDALRGELSLPHSAGKKVRIAIFSPEVEKAIQAEKIDFDILLAKPQDMAKIAPLARFLGPRGLMPNPKTGSVIENPEERAKQLEAGSTLSYKTEPKAPILHLAVANLNQTDKEIEDNIKTTLTGIGINKMYSAYLKSTMSPSIKLELSSI